MDVLILHPTYPLPFPSPNKLLHPRPRHHRHHSCQQATCHPSRYPAHPLPHPPHRLLLPLPLPLPLPFLPQPPPNPRTMTKNLLPSDVAQPCERAPHCPSVNTPEIV